MNHLIVSISDRVPEQWYYLYKEYLETIKGQPGIIIQPNYWGGLATKPKVLYQSIKNKIINTKYIIFCDCWDLVFTTTADEIMERYQSFGVPIVISSEKNCFPDDLKADFDKIAAPTNYKYLNSGFIVGETDAILTCLEEMDLPNLPDDYYDPILKKNIHPNDQFEWQKIFVKQPVPIALDYYQALSQTLHDCNIDEFDLSKDRIRNKITNSIPCAFHFNGGSKDKIELREPILKHLKLM